MAKTVAAADANRRFSELLRHVRAGRTYVITSHGRAVAKIVPIDTRPLVMSGARAGLFARLRAQPGVAVARWTRDELYRDE